MACCLEVFSSRGFKNLSDENTFNFLEHAESVFHNFRANQSPQVIHQRPLTAYKYSFFVVLRQGTQFYTAANTIFYSRIRQ